MVSRVQYEARWLINQLSYCVYRDNRIPPETKCHLMMLKTAHLLTVHGSPHQCGHLGAFVMHVPTARYSFVIEAAVGLCPPRGGRFRKKRAAGFQPPWPGPAPEPSAFEPLRSISTACSCIRSPATTWRIAASSAACALAVIRDLASWVCSAVRSAVTAADSECLLGDSGPEASPDDGGK